jgi:pilus assembly protein CpaE
VQQAHRVVTIVSPASPEGADTVEVGEMVALLTKLRTLFDVIVVDTDSYLDCLTSWILQTADRLVVLATAHPASIKNSILMLRALRRLEVGPRRITVVLNRAEPSIGISVERAESVLGYWIMQQLSHAADSIQESLRRGGPLAGASPGHLWRMG